MHIELLKAIHFIELELGRRLSDGECSQVVKMIKGEVIMSNLYNWANNLPQEVKDNILRG